jgi:hypothetical protein
MLKQSYILFSLILLSFTSVAKDYTDYHKAIIKAERQIFVSNQIDSGLNTYMQVFKEFDFVFLHDCVIALQIAEYANNEKAFKIIIDKAIKNGLTKSHLPEKSFLKTHTIFIKNSEWIDALLTKNRLQYLKRLDTTAVKRLYSLFEYDQSQKNYLKPEYGNESVTGNSRRYGPIIKDLVQQLKELIAQKGWLSDKLVGVDDEHIIKELKLQGLDLVDYYNKYYVSNECVMNAEQFDIGERECSSTLIMPILVHHNTLQGTGNLYDTTFYFIQIAVGNMHPKDFAMINDDRHFTKREGGIGQFFFGIFWGNTMTVGQTLPVPDTIINKNRERFFIAPIEQDRAKWKFMKEHNMLYEFGFWGCRS